MLFAREIDKGLVEDAPASAAGTSRGDFGGVADTQHRASGAVGPSDEHRVSAVLERMLNLLDFNRKAALAARQHRARRPARNYHRVGDFAEGRYRDERAARAQRAGEQMD